jgi:hypothetical protein
LHCTVLRPQSIVDLQFCTPLIQSATPVSLRDSFWSTRNAHSVRACGWLALLASNFTPQSHSRK